MLLAPPRRGDQVSIRGQQAVPLDVEPGPVVLWQPAVLAVQLDGFAQVEHGVDEGVAHVGFGDGEVWVEGDVDDGLGVWDFEGYGAAAGWGAGEEG